MTHLTHGLLLAASLLVGLAIALGFPSLPGQAAEFRVPFGVGVALGLGLLHAQVLSYRSRCAFDRRLKKLDQVHVGTVRALEAASRRIETLSSEIEEQRTRNETDGEVMQEMHALLRSLGAGPGIDADKFSGMDEADAGPLPLPVTPYGAAAVALAAPSPRMPAFSAMPLPKPVPVAAAAPVLVTDTVAAEAETEGAEAANPEFDSVVAMIRAALSARELEMFVQPVMRLPQRRPALYEVLCRLRDESGSLVPPARFLDVAEQSGLIVELDNALLFRCLEQVRQDVERGTDATYQFNISPQTLSDRRFFPQIVACLTTNPQIRDALVLELKQEDLPRLDKRARHQLGRLISAGFQLSLDHVGTLDFDPAPLVDQKFRYLKVNAASLIPTIGRAPALDLRAFTTRLEQIGMALIVEKIESEAMLLELLDYDIDFGQGYLFGEPRRSR